MKITLCNLATLLLISAFNKFKCLFLLLLLLLLLLSLLLLLLLLCLLLCFLDYSHALLIF